MNFSLSEKQIKAIRVVLGFSDDLSVCLDTSGVEFDLFYYFILDNYVTLFDSGSACYLSNLERVEPLSFDAIIKDLTFSVMNC